MLTEVTAWWSPPSLESIAILDTGFEKKAVLLILIPPPPKRKFAKEESIAFESVRNGYGQTMLVGDDAVCIGAGSGCSVSSTGKDVGSNFGTAPTTVTA